jgi:Homeodomain-like domain
MKEYRRQGDLTPKQQRAVQLRVEGKQICEIAEAVAVHRGTVSRWLHRDEGFIAALNMALLDLHEDETTLVRSLRRDALEVVAGAIRTGDLQAAMKFLNLRLTAPLPGPTDPNEIVETKARNDFTRSVRAAGDAAMAAAIDTSNKRGHRMTGPPGLALATARKMRDWMPEAGTTKASVLRQIEWIDDALTMVLRVWVTEEDADIGETTGAESKPHSPIMRARHAVEEAWLPFEQDEDEDSWPGAAKVARSLDRYGEAVRCVISAVGTQSASARDREAIRRATDLLDQARPGPDKPLAVRELSRRARMIGEAMSLILAMGSGEEEG